MIIIPFKEYHAARISDPAQYDSIVTKDLGEGIQLLLGVRKEGDTEKTETQSYHFDKEKWKPKDVKKWLKEHNEKPIELAMAKKEDKSMKENATIVSHKGDVVQEQVPIDKVPEKLFGNVRQQDVPELLESTIDATVSIGEVQKESELEDLGELEEPSIEPEEVMGSDSEEGSEESPMEEMEGEEGNEPEEKPWDPIQAKSDMINWATDNEGKVSKKSLMKWYLDVDAGDGQDSNSYRYQVGAVVNGEPHYCHKALDFSWDLASGNQTGVANRNIQKKIIFIKNREGMPLTEDQMDYSERHMSAEKVTYHTLEDDNSPGGLDFVEQTELKLNSSPAGSKIIYEDDSVIDVPVVPMREGVFTGTDGIPTLKKFEYFGKDAHWLEGQPILKGHTAPTELVTYKHNRIGKLMNVTARPDKKDVVAVARYYKDKLTPEDMARIKSGTPYDGSIAYTTHTSMTPGELNGTKYNAIEDGGYHFYHFAELANGIGACSTKDGCGFMLNESDKNKIKLNYRCKKQGNSYKCPNSVSEDSPVVTKLHSYEKDGRKGGVFKTPSGKYFAVVIDANGEKHAWNAHSQKNARRLAATYVNDGQVAGIHDQADELRPVSENSKYDPFNDPYKLLDVVTFYNNKRRADILQNDQTWSIKLNSSIGGSGILEASSEQDAIDWSKTYVKSGLIPMRMKLNSNCPDSEKTGEGPGSCGGSSKDLSSVSKTIQTHEDYSKMPEQVRNKLINNHTKQIKIIEDDIASLNATKKEVEGTETGKRMIPFLDKDIEGLTKDLEESKRILLKLQKKTKQNSKFSNLKGNNMTEEEFIQADDIEVVDVQKMNEAFEQKLNERDAKIAELTTQVEDLVQKQNAAEQALVDKKAAEDFEAFTQKLNKAHQKDAQVHYDGFKADGWAYFGAHPEVFQAEIPKMNARGSPADEGDNASALQQARDMLKKAQKERFSKRA